MEDGDWLETGRRLERGHRPERGDRLEDGDSLEVDTLPVEDHLFESHLSDVGWFGVK